MLTIMIYFQMMMVDKPDKTRVDEGLTERLNALLEDIQDK